MGARKARLAYQRARGGAMPPPVSPETVKTETILLRKNVAKLVTEEYEASPYHAKLSRSSYIALLIESACEHERMLREQQDQRTNLVQLATHVPNETARRLRALKGGA